MIGSCPDCELPLRNPTLCSCGWKLPKGIISANAPKTITEDQRQRNKILSKQMRDTAYKNAGLKVYEPGEEVE